MAGSKGAGTLRKNTEFWDGSSWSEVADLVLPQGGNSISNITGGGTSNAAWIAGGETASPVGNVASTEHWDGISWTADGNLITARFRLGGTSDQKSAIVFGGNDGSLTGATEEYTSHYSTGSFGRLEVDEVIISNDTQLVVSQSLGIPVYRSNIGIVSSSAGQMWFNSTDNKLNFTMDVNSWSAGGNMILARSYPAGTGIQNAAMAVGGTSSGVKNETELYDGSAWSEVDNLNTARWGLAATGTQTSALAFGGYTPSPAVTHHETELYNGSSWSEVSDLIVGRLLHAGIGTQNAALAAAGYEHSPAVELNDTEEWDGTSWYAAADNNRTDRKVVGAGTQNAGIIFGGSNYSAPTHTMHAFTETYDGTTWTERNDMNFGRGVHAGAGTQNATIAFGGQTEAGSNQTSATEEWNGTSWSVANSMGTARRNLGGAGTQAAALAFAGDSPTTTAATEEYSVSHLKTVEIDGV